MLIDWFTVGAQVLNFVVLVWLMKRFLYQPVQDAIAAREQRIADQINDAVEKESHAAAERQTFEDKNRNFDDERAALLAKAAADAGVEGQRLIDEARSAANEQGAKRLQAMAAEAEHLSQAIGSRAREEVFAIARKALADLASVSLEERIAEVFARRLGEITDPAKQRLAAALKATNEPPRLRSAFDLPAGSRATIQKALNETFAVDVPLHYEVAADSVCGIELGVGGEKLAWTIAEYLSLLEAGVAEVMTTPARAAAPLARKPATRTDAEPTAEPTSNPV